MSKKNVKTKFPEPGLLLIDKAEGITSHDVVAKVRRLLNIKAVGHCGTLDPMASGLLVLLLGEATKLSQYILEEDKEYDLRGKLGVSTDTGDSTGKVLQEKEVSVDSAELKKVIEELTGEVSLTVPRYSAIKIQGKKLYEYARKNQEVELPVRKMIFHSVDLLDFGTDWFQASIACSKGTYIRSWVEGVGEALGVGGTLTALRRTGSFPYRVEDSITLEALSERLEEGMPLKEISGFIPMVQALPQWPMVRVQGQDERLLLNGQISHSLKSQLISKYSPATPLEKKGFRILSQRGLLALVGMEKGRGFKIRRVFQQL